ncbi:TonB-dependent receptor [Flavobacteriaceae bacterium]|nr:TonB-dependent receptor [Flavobacteriaceae bacterium]
MKKYLQFVLLASTPILAQDVINSKNLDSLTSILNLEEVTVSAIKAKNDTPVSFVNLSKENIEKTNLAQDIPILLKNTPSVVTHSDAGAGIGYSSIRIRGSDQTRVNVTINGIPYNDSESMQVYWVDLPDFASSIENIQIQRGVGTSTNGPGAFGGSINIQTNSASENPFFEINNTLGSFGTVKNSVGFSTGFIDNFELSGRVSRIKSDGYIDRSGSNLRSYFLQGVYRDENTLIKVLNFAGHEITDQAWYGVDSSTLETNRKYNMAGEYYDEFGNTLYYEDQVDNYKQNHLQIHWNQIYQNGWNSNFGIHFTNGKGFFENYNLGYGSSDYIDRRWLDNDFYGILYSLNKKTEDFNANIGGSLNKYNGLHYGEYLWYDQINSAVNQYDFKEKFYDDFGDKGEFNIYAKIDYYITDKLTLYGDLQFRNIKYEAGISANSTLTGYIEDGFENLDKSFNFFNPKFGLFYNLNDNNNLFFSFARAHREPTRTDYANGNPNEEKLDDFELGWKLNSNNLALSLNAFYMIYEDQLVLTGQRDINGYEIRRNIGESYRVGIEFDSSIKLNNKLNIETNFSLSENKNKDFYSTFDGNLKNFGNTDLAYSPNLILNNILNFKPNKKVLISLRSKYVSEQFFAQTNSPISKLESFFINDINFVHDIDLPNISDDIKFKVLVNNLFDYKYSAYGGYYSYDIQEDNQVKTYEGTYYYPQSGINILIGLDVKF